MNHRTILLVVIIFFVSFLTGCGSQKELTAIAIVAAFGIDKDENGKYVGTFQIVNPANVAGGLQGGSAGEGAAVTVYKATGKNIVDVSRRASIKVSRMIYYAHTNLVVIGEEIAREDGIAEVLDALDRDVEFRTTTKLVISRGVKASELLSITTPIDKIPSKKVIENIKYSEKRWGGNVSTNVREVIECLTNSGKEAVVPGYTVQGSIEEGKQVENLHNTLLKTNIHVDGIAIFKGDKLVDWVNENDAQGIVWILDKIKETSIPINWKGKEDVISYQVMRDKVKIAAKMNDSLPSFLINIKVKGDLGEVDAPVNINDRKVLDEIERKVEKKVKEKILHAVHLAQKNKTDVLGFGEKVYRSNPKAWKKIKSDWNEQYFPNLNVKVTVDASILRTGLKTNPFIFQMDNNR
ncbi:Ger(x)C family spore germination protein [Bacillus sp. IITD106]|nr:Ger(x)C family spore germination protein [Bacillus sp. IITD106]